MLRRSLWLRFFMAAAPLLVVHGGALWSRAEQVAAEISAASDASSAPVEPAEPTSPSEPADEDAPRFEFRVAVRELAEGQLLASRRLLEAEGPQAGGDLPYRWFVIDHVARFVVGEVDQAAFEKDPEAYFADRQLIAAKHAGSYYLLLGNDDSSSLRDDGRWQVDSLSQTNDDLGRPAIGVKLDAEGGRMLSQLTRNHLGEPMAVLHAGRVLSVPVIQSVIGNTIQITGGGSGFSSEEVARFTQAAQQAGVQPSVANTAGPMAPTPGAFGLSTSLLLVIGAAMFGAGAVALILILAAIAVVVRRRAGPAAS